MRHSSLTITAAKKAYIGLRDLPANWFFQTYSFAKIGSPATKPTFTWYFGFLSTMPQKEELAWTRPLHYSPKQNLFAVNAKNLIKSLDQSNLIFAQLIRCGCYRPISYIYTAQGFPVYVFVSVRDRGGGFPLPKNWLVSPTGPLRDHAPKMLILKFWCNFSPLLPKHFLPSVDLNWKPPYISIHSSRTAP